jgi:hypothetical protein
VTNVLAGETSIRLTEVDSLRLAWESAIALISQNALDERLRPAAAEIDVAFDRLVVLSGDTLAPMRAAQAYLALKNYEMPDYGPEELQLEDAAWTLFLYLVLAVQERSLLRSEYYALALELLTEGRYRKSWWRLRALTYAQLGLPVGTRV